MRRDLYVGFGFLFSFSFSFGCFRYGSDSHAHTHTQKQSKHERIYVYKLLSIESSLPPLPPPTLPHLSFKYNTRGQANHVPRPLIKAMPLLPLPSFSHSQSLFHFFFYSSIPTSPPTNALRVLPSPHCPHSLHALAPSQWLVPVRTVMCNVCRWVDECVNVECVRLSLCPHTHTDLHTCTHTRLYIHTSLRWCRHST